MDPISQGVVGAMLAQCVAPRAQRPGVTLVGALSAMSADLDVLIRSDSDPLLHLDFHRHFTHSLLFAPIGGLLAALILWPFVRRFTGWSSTLRASVAGYATAGLLDACTSYGTHLLWPFSDERIAWSCISIVDPVFTLVLLVLVGLACRRHRRWLPWVALSFAASYLSLGVVQRDRAEAALVEHARERGHSPSRVTVKPTIGNLILWRGIYRDADTWHVAAVRAGAGAPMVTEGDSAPALDGPPPGIPSQSVVADDVERFRRFSDGTLCRVPEHPTRITDLRYARLPHRIAPLWAIDYDPQHPEQHVRFETFRKLSPDERDEFLDLLLGR